MVYYKRMIYGSALPILLAVAVSASVIPQHNIPQQDSKQNDSSYQLNLDGIVFDLDPAEGSIDFSQLGDTEDVGWTLLELLSSHGYDLDVELKSPQNSSASPLMQLVSVVVKDLPEEMALEDNPLDDNTIQQESSQKKPQGSIPDASERLELIPLEDIVFMNNISEQEKPKEQITEIISAPDDLFSDVRLLPVLVIEWPEELSLEDTDLDDTLLNDTTVKETHLKDSSSEDTPMKINLLEQKISKESSHQQKIKATTSLNDTHLKVTPSERTPSKVSKSEKKITKENSQEKTTKAPTHIENAPLTVAPLKINMLEQKLSKENSQEQMTKVEKPSKQFRDTSLEEDELIMYKVDKKTGKS